jgi:spore coat polysaccharide biosynthesis predicted glycosyltransferase SpsG
VLCVADAGEDAGLGHVGRSTAVAVALRSRGIESRCRAFGVDDPFTFDGVDWAPLRDDELAVPGHAVVIDSYRLSHETLEAVAARRPLVYMRDFGSAPRGTALVVSVSGASAGGPECLSGLAYAALRPAYWGLPARTRHERVRRVLVTTGSGLAETGRDLAAAIADGIRDTTVTLVRGPHATIDAPPGVELLDAPHSLLEPLLDADLVVTAAGQSLLEAAAAGTPSIGVVLTENQRPQATGLAALEAVRLVDSPVPDAVTAACVALAEDVEARRGLSRNAQRAVDGFGALRIAFAVAQLTRSR